MNSGENISYIDVASLNRSATQRRAAYRGDTVDFLPFQLTFG
jgi:hypothetical protein